MYFEHPVNKKFFFDYRQKVDLTRYIEEHLFEFDNSYSHEADN